MSLLYFSETKSESQANDQLTQVDPADRNKGGDARRKIISVIIGGARPSEILKTNTLVEVW